MVDSERNAPIDYMQRTRVYYQALEFGDPYRWAQHDEIPFTPLVKPVSEATIALVTTAVRFDPQFGEQGPGANYNGAAKFFEVYAESTAGEPDLRISHIAIDRAHTTAADQSSYFPLAAVRDAVADGRIGRMAPRFYGLPTDRDQQCTVDQYGNDILQLCRDDAVDAVLLFPNCPVCHQSVSLVARHLEANGVPTVISGCAKDIVEHCGVPRFVFNDFPLGNSAGKPFEPESQAQVLALCLDILASAQTPGTTRINPQHWARSDAWKADFCSIEGLDAAERARLKLEFQRQQELGYAKKKTA